MSHPTNTLIKETKAEWLEENRTYHNQLRKVWLSLVERYPQYYSVDDYHKACNQVGIPTF